MTRKTQPKPFLDWLQEASPTWTWDWAWQLYVQAQLERVTRGEINRLMLFVPPRHGKSEMTTVRYSTYRLEQQPDMRVVIGAYNQTLADKFSRKCLRIAKERLSLSSDRTAVHDWETSAGGGLRAVGVGGGITGQGGDLIIVDDPVKNREEANSLTYRDKVWEWYTDDLYTRLEPGGALILIMTRWHEDDLAGRILASEDAPNWTVVSLPAEAEENDPLGRAIGEPLCPERYGKEALADRKRVLGSYGYTALFQQRPTPIEGGIIKREWIRYYDRLPETIDIWETHWDMAFKDTADGSYVVGQVWAKSGADCYLVDQVRGKLDFPATQSAVVSLHERNPQSSGVYVEDKANGPAIIASLKRVVPGLIGVPVKGSKEARLSAVAPLFEAGNVWIPKTHWIADYVGELTAYPNAANDDQCDTTSQALDHLTETCEPRMRAL